MLRASHVNRWAFSSFSLTLCGMLVRIDVCVLSVWMAIWVKEFFSCFMFVRIWRFAWIHFSCSHGFSVRQVYRYTQNVCFVYLTELMAHHIQAYTYTYTTIWIKSKLKFYNSRSAVFFFFFNIIENVSSSFHFLHVWGKLSLAVVEWKRIWIGNVHIYITLRISWVVNSCQ